MPIMNEAHLTFLYVASRGDGLKKKKKKVKLNANPTAVSFSQNPSHCSLTEHNRFEIQTYHVIVPSLSLLLLWLHIQVTEKKK